MREIGDPVGQGNTLTTIGNVHYSEGRGEDAMAMWAEAIEIYDKIGASTQAATTRWNMGVLLASAGQRDEARPLLQAQVDYYAEIGHAETQARAGRMKQLLSE
ncbi:MAG: tetratricopeptide repeat protein [Planctomycetota bacterium]